MFLYNTLSRQKEEMKAMDGKRVRFYACGPTVYDAPHVGNMRAYVLEDLLKRTLFYLGFSVKHVMNITDVGHLISDEDEGEDKMEKGSRREGKSVWEIANMYTRAFFSDMEKLDIIKPDVVCKATDHIPQQIALVKTLEKKDLTYVIEDGIYFNTSKLKDYGKLAKLDIKGLEAGKRVEVARGKRNMTDFALWKFSPQDGQRQMEWIFDGPRSGKLIVSGDFSPLEKEIVKRSEIEKSLSTPPPEKEHRDALVADRRSLSASEAATKGFPGWHIECSAMAMKYLGESFDLHAGGVDHIPVHHTNEIAQSEAATGKPYVRHWMHIEHLQVEGKKMSKSLGNFYTVSSLEKKGFTPRAIRFLYLSSHYRQQQNFTIKALEQATNTLEGIDQFVRELGSVIAILSGAKGKQSRTKKKKTENIQTLHTKYIPAFDAALSDDLNIPQASSVLFDFIRETNPLLVEGKLSYEDAQATLAWLKKINEVLAVLRFDFDEEIPEAVAKLMKERERARKDRDFAASDRLRAEIEELDYSVRDSQQGQKVTRK